jgi:hypothetical protein
MQIDAYHLALGIANEAAEAPYFILLPETRLGEVYRGDTLILPIWEARDQRGTLIDLTNATIWFTAKTDLSLADTAPGVIQHSTGLGGIVIIDPVLGTYRVTVAPSETSHLTDDTTFIFDVQVRTLTPVTATVKRGTLTVVRDVTRTTA